MKYEPVQLYLQDYLNMVHFFQTEFLQNLDAVKALTGYRYRKYPNPRSSASYNNLLNMLIYHNLQYNLISKAAISVLDDHIDRYFRSFQLKNAQKSPLINRFRNEDFPNRISLTGYSIPAEERAKAQQNLLQIMSVDESFLLIYTPEMIQRNYFVIYRQR